METLLMRIDEVAKVLGICPATVRELINEKDLPAVRIGRAVRVPVAQLHAWIDEHAHANRVH